MSKVRIVPFAPLTLFETTGEETYATLSWSIRLTYPRITVYTENHKGKKTPFDYNKLITAPFDPVTINTFINMLNEVIESKDEIKKAIKCYNIKYVDNVKTDDVILQATVIVGKDKDGVIYLAATADDKKKIKFKLLPNTKWHKFVNSNGDEITDKGKLSVMHAKAYSARLKSLMDKYVLDNDIVKYTDKPSTSVDNNIDNFDSQDI